MKTAKLILLYVAALALAGCHLPTPQERDSQEDESATFFLEEVKGTIQMEKTGGDFDLPIAKIYNFKVCAKDQNYRSAVLGGKFKIAEINQEVHTDQSGCLSWSEELEYNFLNDSRYIQLKRTVEGLGLHKGSRVLNIAVNPWMHGDTGAEAVVDLAVKTVPALLQDRAEISAALQGRTFRSGERRRALWVEGGRFFSVQKAFKADKTLDLEIEGHFTPQIRLNKMNGDVTFADIQKGKFNVEMMLIHQINTSEGSTRRLILAKSEQLEGQVVNKTLSVKTVLNLSALPTLGQLYAGVKISPAKQNKGLKPFEGIFYVGEYDNLKTASFLRVASEVTKDNDFKIASFATESIQDVLKDKSIEALEAYQTPGFKVERLRFDRMESINVLERNVRRTVNFRTETQVINGIDRKAVRGQTFTITKFRQNESEPAVKEEVKVGNDGIIVWQTQFEYDYFGCQRYIQGFIEIENKTIGLKERIDMLLNPWEGWRILGADSRYVRPHEHFPVSCEKNQTPSAKMVIDKFSFEQTDITYEIDDQLNLTWKKNTIFVVEPRVTNYSNLYNGRDDNDAHLRDGQYLLKMVIVRNRAYLADKEDVYITSLKKIASVTSGRLWFKGQFETQQIEELGNKNHVFMQILPVDESAIEMVSEGVYLPKDRTKSLDDVVARNTDLESPVHEGYIILKKDDESFKMYPLKSAEFSEYYMTGKDSKVKSWKSRGGDDYINALIALGEQQMARRQRMNLQRAHTGLFAKENNLVLTKIGSEEYQNLVQGLSVSPDLFRHGPAVNAAAPRFYNEVKAKTAPSAQVEQELKNLLHAGTLSQNLRERLCTYWFQGFMQEQKVNDREMLNDYAYIDLLRDCFLEARRNKREFFQIEKRIFVKKAQQIEELTGSTMGYSVGQSFSVSNSHSDSFSRSLGLSANAGLSLKALDLFSIGGSGSYSISWSTSDSWGTSNGGSIGSSISLDAEIKPIKVRFDSYQRCAVIRLNPLLFVKDLGKDWYTRDADYNSKLNERLSDLEKTQAATRGILLCQDEKVQNPALTKVENYYFISANTDKAQLVDGFNSKNRPFTINLRGSNELNKFIVAARLQEGIPTNAVAETSRDLEQLERTIKLFQLGLPGYPGSYLEK